MDPRRVSADTLFFLKCYWRQGFGKVERDPAFREAGGMSSKTASLNSQDRRRLWVATTGPCERSKNLSAKA